MEVVSNLKDTQAYCTALQHASQPVTCAIWLENASSKACPRDPEIMDDCLWSVYVGENQTTHTVRWATFLVNPGTKGVVGVSDAMCGIMKLSAWRQWRAAQKAGAPMTDCPAGAE